jgi:hypothetical protein
MNKQNKLFSLITMGTLLLSLSPLVGMYHQEPPGASINRANFGGSPDFYSLAARVSALETAVLALQHIIHTQPTAAPQKKNYTCVAATGAKQFLATASNKLQAEHDAVSKCQKPYTYSDGGLSTQGMACKIQRCEESEE